MILNCNATYNFILFTVILYIEQGVSVWRREMEIVNISFYKIDVIQVEFNNCHWFKQQELLFRMVNVSRRNRNVKVLIDTYVLEINGWNVNSSIARTVVPLSICIWCGLFWIPVVVILQNILQCEMMIDSFCFVAFQSI